MSPRPSSIRILGRTFKVLYHAPTRYGDQPLGNCDCSSLTINITEGQHPVEERDTVLHEVLHALFYLMCVPTGEEEGIVRPISSGLMGVFLDNPEFAKWLSTLPKESPKK